MSLLIVILLGLWFVASVVNQLRPGHFQWCARFLDWISRHDVIYAIPGYHFFAPNPIMFDYELLYRDRLHGDVLTPWRAIEFLSTSTWRAVWNPQKRQAKIVTMFCAKLSRQARLQIEGQRRPHEIYLSDSYVGLAHFVARAPHSVAGIETQFLIAVRPGFETHKEAAIVFVSPFFRL